MHSGRAKNKLAFTWLLSYCSYGYYYELLETVLGFQLLTGLLPFVHLVKF
jgi:hypothetical protein